MSVDYVRVQWTEHKKWYDLICVGFFFLLFLCFLITSLISFDKPSQFSFMTLLIRGFGLCAITFIHIILAIGPLARIDKRFLPLLYNRRHLGVMTFFIAFFHVFLVMLFYHGFGVMNPLMSLLIGNTEYKSLSAFPFELFGLGAFFILFMLASTSHDFWQKFFGKIFWKSMHMSIYLAYFLIITHVLLGVYQSEQSLIYTFLIVLGFLSISGLHIAAGIKAYKLDAINVSKLNWVKVAKISEFIQDRAKVITTKNGESVAIFKHKKGFSAVTNVCAHQGGPLSEGKIIDGCITCPWHGWQYKVEDGQSPPPFEEKICTYETKITDGYVYVFAQAKPPGTFITPLKSGELSE